MNLNLFENKNNFFKALKTLFDDLNIPVNIIDEKPVASKEILTKTYKDNNEAFRIMEDVIAFGMVDDAAFSENTAESLDNVKKAKKDYDGILLFGVTLKKRSNGLLPTRTQLAEITRAFNREYYYSPVVVVFRYEDYISIANAERITYKQEWREGEKAGKVSLLRDISIENPHTGHLKILQELTIARSGRNAITNFKELYAYWQKVFSVSILNKQFYKELSDWYFWAIKHVTFPTQSRYVDDKNHENKAQNIIRLLIRLLFVWFIKEKGLIPEELFDLDILQQSILNKISPIHEGNSLFQEENKSIYYKAILQNLFFATLNCPIKSDSIDSRERGFRGDESYGKHRGVDYLMRYKKYFKNPDAFLCMVNEVVPFLNGGLFECLDDKENKIYIDGFSDNMSKTEGLSNQLVVPDYLFFGTEEKTDLNVDYGIKNKGTKEAAVKGLINILKSYKFTIDENTPIEEDVALDPELLGKVFENLLASYNPETKTTARKQTGSFYTPREIVNYMVDESLIAHLKNRLNDLVTDEKELDDKLHQLLSYDDIQPFEDEEIKKAILKAIDECKILDPACGSGAFPMGAMQKMVHIIHKLDPQNKRWQDLQLEKAQKETKGVFSIENKEEREQLLLEINEAFDQTVNNPDYARKLYLIENCIYGVDIQPIAVQISKLRFFISLVVDQKINKNKNNFGIRPLPNLETKIVAANTLIGIDKPDSMQKLFEKENIQKLETELKDIRHKIFSLKSPSRKKYWRNKDREVREKLSKLIEEQLNKETESSLKNDRKTVEIAYYRDLIKRNGEKESYLKEITAREKKLEKLRENFQSSNHKTGQQLAGWDPYDQNASSPFFDPEWMFDIADGFDVVIGNPPYIDSEGMVNTGQEWLRELLSATFNYTKGNWDIYIAFFEISFRFLTKAGSLSFITPDKWLTKPFGKAMRKDTLKYLRKLFRSGREVFETVGVDSIVTLFSNNISKDFVFFDYIDGSIKRINNISKEIIAAPYQLDIVFSKHLSLLISITNNNNTLSEEYSIDCENACATSDCYTLNGILKENNSNEVNEEKYYRVINTGTIGQFVSKWGKKEMTYLGGKYLRPIVLKKFFHTTFPNSYGRKVNSPKLIIKGLTLLDCTIDSKGIIIPGKSTLIIQSESIQIIRQLSLIINSKIALFYLKERYSASSYNTGINFTKDMINNLPVPAKSNVNEKYLEQIIAILIYINAYGHVSNIFSKVHNAIIFNLYFPDHMKERGIDVLQYVEQDIDEVMQGKEFEKLSGEQKELVIDQLLKRWTDPQNEVVKRMAMFKEKSPDILKPILES